MKNRFYLFQIPKIECLNPIFRNSNKNTKKKHGNDLFLCVKSKTRYEAYMLMQSKKKNDLSQCILTVSIKQIWLILIVFTLKYENYIKQQYSFAEKSSSRCIFSYFHKHFICYENLCVCRIVWIELKLC